MDELNFYIFCIYKMISKTTMKWATICIIIAGLIGVIIWLLLRNGSNPGNDRWACDSSGSCVKTPDGPFAESTCNNSCSGPGPGTDKYDCDSSGNCVKTPDGKYSESTCSNQCSGGGGKPGRFTNVLLLDPSMPDLQNQVDQVTKDHGAWCLAPEYQFSQKRTLILLQPGNYPITIGIGYYMSVAGLGKSPSDVTIDGIQVYNGNRDVACNNPISLVPSGGNATENFWRSVENLTINDNPKPEPFAVSQAAPMRRVHCKASINLQDAEGWASGGFTADSIFDQQVDRLGNQQWFFRNCSIGQPSTCGNWNTMFLGCKGQVADKCGGNQCISVNDTNLVTVQKPTLFMESGQYKILRPKPKKGAGPITLDEYENGDVFTNIYIANDQDDTADSINKQINAGQHIVLSPGIYNFTESIVVTKDSTMIIGFGMPTILSSGTPCIVVKDVSNVVVASVILDCGPNKTTTLLKWGTKKEDHPGYAHDIFTRVGGAVDYKTSCDSMVEINSNGVIGDNFWLWRADHGIGMNADPGDFSYNVSTNGLVVNGDNVVMYGLAVEHCQEDLVSWVGEYGSTYWFQSEVPYDMPPGWDYYAYHVADNVKTHTAIGMGSYTFLYQPVMIPNAFKSPDPSTTPGIIMKGLFVWNGFPSGNSGWTHIYNNQGGPVYTGNTASYLCN